MHSFWASRRIQGATPTSPGAMTVWDFLRLSTSLFVGIICVISVSLPLLLLIVNIPGISVNSSLHHDFQTVSVVPVVQWSNVPGLRSAVELRWLWSSLNLTFFVGLFPKERIDRLVGWMKSVKMYFRMRSAARFSRKKFHIDNNGRAWHRSAQDAASHGSLPVYFSRAETPVIPSIIRQSTLAPTFISRVSSGQLYQHEALFPMPEFDIHSKIAQVGETIQPIEHTEPEETPQPNQHPQPSLSLHQSEPILTPTTSMLTLADVIYPASSLGEASSYRTCEELIGS